MPPPPPFPLEGLLGDDGALGDGVVGVDPPELQAASTPAAPTTPAAAMTLRRSRPARGSYDSIDDAIRTIQQGERPLALYVFTNDTSLVAKLQRETASGGMCVNLAAAQGAIPSLGFGGIGNSGSGRHHGHDGFREFSNPRGVFTLGPGAGGLNAFLPPYGPSKRRQIDQLFALRRFQLRVGKTLRP